MPAPKVSHRAQGVERHLAAAAEYIAIAESGDPEKSALQHAAEEIAAAMEQDSSLTQTEVARRLGKGKNYVHTLLRALSCARRTGTFEVDWARGAPRGARQEVERTARERPDAFAAAFEAAPPEAKRKIAERISRAPEVRSEARKRDVEAEQQRRPEPVQPRPDLLMYQAQSKLSAAEAALRQFLAIISEIDQAGDDEDVAEQIERIEKLAAIAREAYTSGKSIDTWALELFEEHERSSE